MNPFNLVLPRTNNSSQIEPLTADGVLVLQASDTQLPSIYFPQVERAYKYQTLNTTKEFVVLFSTDHDGGVGGIVWGEADDRYLNGYVERGLIKQGFQAETPDLKFIVNDPDNKFLHLTYHTNETDPTNNGIQSTHLLRRNGGNLHDSGWSVHYNILGATAEELSWNPTHLGYLMTFLKPDNSLVGIHHTKGYENNTIDGVNRYGKSISTDGINWTRVTSRIDNTSFMSVGRLLHMNPVFYFERNGFQYMLGINISYGYSYDGARICITKTNGDYLPIEFIQNISSVNGGDKAKGMYYAIDPQDPDTLHIHYCINTVTPSNPTNKFYYTTWDLRNLDT